MTNFEELNTYQNGEIALPYEEDIRNISIVS